MYKYLINMLFHTAFNFLPTQNQIRKMKKKKKVYISPTIKLLNIDLEDGISASSFTLKTGGVNNEPKIEDWDNSANNKFKNFDL